jgi:hypothetical protein
MGQGVNAMITIFSDFDAAEKISIAMFLKKIDIFRKIGQNRGKIVIIKHYFSDSKMNVGCKSFGKKITNWIVNLISFLAKQFKKRFSRKNTSDSKQPQNVLYTWITLKYIPCFSVDKYAA